MLVWVYFVVFLLVIWLMCGCMMVMCVRFFIFVVGMNGVVIILLLEVYGKGVEC